MQLKKSTENQFDGLNSINEDLSKTLNKRVQEVPSTTWLSLEEVCRLLMISTRTCQSYRDKRILPFSQIGRKIYFKASDIDEYLEAHYIKSRYQKEGGMIL
jgi:excisionase family DNA binding protein